MVESLADRLALCRTLSIELIRPLRASATAVANTTLTANASSAIAEAVATTIGRAAATLQLAVDRSLGDGLGSIAQQSALEAVASLLELGSASSQRQSSVADTTVATAAAAISITSDRHLAAKAASHLLAISAPLSSDPETLRSWLAALLLERLRQCVPVLERTLRPTATTGTGAADEVDNAADLPAWIEAADSAFFSLDVRGTGCLGLQDVVWLFLSLAAPIIRSGGVDGRAVKVVTDDPQLLLAAGGQLASILACAGARAEQAAGGSAGCTSPNVSQSWIDASLVFSQPAQHISDGTTQQQQHQQQHRESVLHPGESALLQRLGVVSLMAWRSWLATACAPVSLTPSDGTVHASNGAVAAACALRDHIQSAGAALGVGVSSTGAGDADGDHHSAISASGGGGGAAGGGIHIAWYRACSQAVAEQLLTPSSPPRSARSVATSASTLVSASTILTAELATTGAGALLCIAREGKGIADTAASVTSAVVSTLASLSHGDGGGGRSSTSRSAQTSSGGSAGLSITAQSISTACSHAPSCVARALQLYEQSFRHCVPAALALIDKESRIAESSDSPLPQLPPFAVQLVLHVVNRVRTQQQQRSMSPTRRMAAAATAAHANSNGGLAASPSRHQSPEQLHGHSSSLSSLSASFAYRPRSPSRLPLPQAETSKTHSQQQHHQVWTNTAPAHATGASAGAMPLFPKASSSYPSSPLLPSSPSTAAVHQNALRGTGNSGSGGAAADGVGHSSFARAISAAAATAQDAVVTASRHMPSVSSSSSPPPSQGIEASGRTGVLGGAITSGIHTGDSSGTNTNVATFTISLGDLLAGGGATERTDEDEDDDDDGGGGSAGQRVGIAHVLPPQPQQRARGQPPPPQPQQQPVVAGLDISGIMQQSEDDDATGSDADVSGHIAPAPHRGNGTQRDLTAIPASALMHMTPTQSSARPGAPMHHAAGAGDHFADEDDNDAQPPLLELDHRHHQSQQQLQHFQVHPRGHSRQATHASAAASVTSLHTLGSGTSPRETVAVSLGVDAGDAAGSDGNQARTDLNHYDDADDDDDDDPDRSTTSVFEWQPLDNPLRQSMSASMLMAAVQREHNLQPLQHQQQQHAGSNAHHGRGDTNLSTSSSIITAANSITSLDPATLAVGFRPQSATAETIRTYRHNNGAPAASSTVIGSDTSSSAAVNINGSKAVLPPPPPPPSSKRPGTTTTKKRPSAIATATVGTEHRDTHFAASDRTRQNDVQLQRPRDAPSVSPAETASDTGGKRLFSSPASGGAVVNTGAGSPASGAAVPSTTTSSTPYSSSLPPHQQQQHQQQFHPPAPSSPPPPPPLLIQASSAIEYSHLQSQLTSCIDSLLDPLLTSEQRDGLVHHMRGLRARIRTLEVVVSPPAVPGAAASTVSSSSGGGGAMSDLADNGYPSAGTGTGAAALSPVLPLALDSASQSLVPYASVLQQANAAASMSWTAGHRAGTVMVSAPGAGLDVRNAAVAVGGNHGHPSVDRYFPSSAFASPEPAPIPASAAVLAAAMTGAAAGYPSSGRGDGMVPSTLHFDTAGAPAAAPLPFASTSSSAAVPARKLSSSASSATMSVDVDGDDGDGYSGGYEQGRVYGAAAAGPVSQRASAAAAAVSTGVRGRQPRRSHPQATGHQQQQLLSARPANASSSASAAAVTVPVVPMARSMSSRSRSASASRRNNSRSSSKGAGIAVIPRGTFGSSGRYPAVVPSGVSSGHAYAPGSAAAGTGGGTGPTSAPPPRPPSQHLLLGTASSRSKSRGHADDGVSSGGPGGEKAKQQQQQGDDGSRRAAAASSAGAGGSVRSTGNRATGAVLRGKGSKALMMLSPQHAQQPLQQQQQQQHGGSSSGGHAARSPAPGSHRPATSSAATVVHTSRSPRPAAALPAHAQGFHAPAGAGSLDGGKHWTIVTPAAAAAVAPAGGGVGPVAEDTAQHPSSSSSASAYPSAAPSMQSSTRPMPSAAVTPRPHNPSPATHLSAAAGTATAITNPGHTGRPSQLASAAAGTSSKQAALLLSHPRLKKYQLTDGHLHGTSPPMDEQARRAQRDMLTAAPWPAPTCNAVAIPVATPASSRSDAVTFTVSTSVVGGGAAAAQGVGSAVPLRKSISKGSIARLHAGKPIV